MESAIFFWNFSVLCIFYIKTQSHWLQISFFIMIFLLLYYYYYYFIYLLLNEILFLRKQ